MKRQAKKGKRTAGKEQRGEEKGLRAYFVRLFGKYDFRNEGQFIFFGKWLIFIVLFFVELLIVLQQIDGFSENGGWGNCIALLVVIFVLTLSEVLDLFAVKKNKGKIVFYILEALSACCLLFFTVGTYPIIVYMLVLTEFYISAEKSKPSLWLFFLSVPLYAISYGSQVAIRIGEDVNLFQIFRQSLGSIVALTAHFIAVHIALAFYRQFLRLDRALRELAESKKELEKAYEVVAEVTALEERQRIAKEIHDTAGHSITTVIMQTEAAKRILETDLDEAKNKIIAANLQAKHALEELRDSVHLLSGATENRTLKDALLGVIHESTDGTGITIRSEIENAEVSEAKYRFLCNTLKEGISNGLRHGGATAFWFELKTEAGKLRFLLSDNGKGVPTGGLKRGFGLTTMQDRAKSLGGEVAFYFEDGEGFEIRLVLPTDTEK